MSSFIRPGDLQDRLSIQASTSSPQAGGGKIKAWADIASPIWAKVEPLNGGEAFSQGIARNTQFYRITIRWRGDVTPANRLMWNGMALNIRTCADPDRSRTALLITAESGVGEP